MVVRNKFYKRNQIVLIIVAEMVYVLMDYAFVFLDLQHQIVKKKINKFTNFWKCVLTIAVDKDFVTEIFLMENVFAIQDLKDQIVVLNYSKIAIK